jgi:hypothetical protein
MTRRAVNRVPFAKTVIAITVLFGIGLALGGIDFFLASRGIGKSADKFGVGPLDSLALGILLLSTIGLIVTIAAWLIAAVIRHFTSRGNGPNPFFDDTDDTQR